MEGADLASASDGDVALELSAESLAAAEVAEAAMHEEETLDGASLDADALPDIEEEIFEDPASVDANALGETEQLFWEDCEGNVGGEVDQSYDAPEDQLEAPLVEEHLPMEATDEPADEANAEHLDFAPTEEPLPVPVPVVVPAGPVELTKDERALRGLLQFYVCADARRQGGGGAAAAPLQMRYRELVALGYEVIQRAPGATAGESKSPEELISERPVSTGQGVASPAADAEVVPSTGGSLVSQIKVGMSKVSMSKEQLKKHLIAKKQSLEIEMQRLRRQHALSSQAAPPTVFPAWVDDIDDETWVDDTVYPAEPVPVDEAYDQYDLTPHPPQVSVPKPPPPLAPPPGDHRVSKRPSTPKPPPPLLPHVSNTAHGIKRPAELPVSRTDRESLLRRKWHEVLEAEMEEERLKAKKHGLEELRGKLQKQLGDVRAKRSEAAKLSAERRKEDIAIQARLRQALAASKTASLEPALDNGTLTMEE